MKTMGIRELKAHMSEAIHQVREGQTIEVTHHGEVVALLVPPLRRLSNEEIEAALDSIDSLAAQIGAHWPEGVTALEAVQDARRDL